MADPSLFVLNHYPMDSTWMFLNSKPSLNEFLNAPLIYSSIHTYQVHPRWPKTFQVSTPKNKVVVFRFSSDNYKAFEKTTLQINGSMISPKTYTDQAGWQNIEHVFHYKGKYVVHVLMDEHYVASYNVSVH
jgi:hypothetical protein